MEVKRFFKLQEELLTLHAMCLVIDFDSMGFGCKKFLSYELFKKFIKEEFNDYKTVLQTAMLSSFDSSFTYMCLGSWHTLPAHIETVD